MSDERQPTQHNESVSSAALDGARIALFVAINVLASDQSLSQDKRIELLAPMEGAAGALDYARDLFQVETTSVHIARPNESGLIIPG